MCARALYHRRHRVILLDRTRDAPSPFLAFALLSLPHPSSSLLSSPGLFSRARGNSPHPINISESSSLPGTSRFPRYPRSTAEACPCCVAFVLPMLVFSKHREETSPTAKSGRIVHRRTIESTGGINIREGRYAGIILVK